MAMYHMGDDDIANNPDNSFNLNMGGLSIAAMTKMERWMDDLTQQKGVIVYRLEGKERTSGLFKVQVWTTRHGRVENAGYWFYVWHDDKMLDRTPDPAKATAMYRAVNGGERMAQEKGKELMKSYHAKWDALLRRIDDLNRERKQRTKDIDEEVRRCNCELANLKGEEIAARRALAKEKVEKLRPHLKALVDVIDHSRASCSDENPCNGVYSNGTDYDCPKCALMDILEGRAPAENFEIRIEAWLKPIR